jgi:alpha-D-xyloside xylohydrolase
MSLPAAPLDRIPVLVPAGSILPLGPIKQWHDETPDDPIELRIYSGADGAFTLYEDAGDGYGYEHGEHSRVAFTWNDARRELSVSARQGWYPGMPVTRTFRVVLVGPGAGIGVDPSARGDAEIRYDGRPVTVVLTPSM